MRKMMLLMLFTSFIFSACSSYNFYSVGSNKVDIKKYHTYAWVNGNESKLEDYYNNDIAEENIIESGNTALNARGLELDSKQPDLLIRYTAVVDDKSRVIADPVYYQRPSYYRPVRGYYGGRAFYYYQYIRPFPVYVGSDQREVSFEEGNIVVDLIDRRTSKVVWRGVAKGEVDNPAKAVNDLPKVITRIFGKLPS